MRRLSRSPWTRDQDEELVLAYKRGDTAAMIANVIGRPRSSIWQRAHFLGITRATQFVADELPQVVAEDEMLRKCLSCLKMFPSAWIGNRLCDRCLRNPELFA